MDDHPPLASAARTASAVPRFSKLPRPQSVYGPGACDDAHDALQQSVPASALQPPSTPQRAPLQKLQRPQSRQTPWPPTSSGLNGQPKATRHASQQENAQLPNTSPRKSRPSLSDRAIETLSSIPPSPATDRRRSSFFSPQSPMTTRPASAMGSVTRGGIPQNGRASPTKSLTAQRQSFARSTAVYTTPVKSTVNNATSRLAASHSRNVSLPGRTSPVKPAPKQAPVGLRAPTSLVTKGRASIPVSGLAAPRSGLNNTVKPSPGRPVARPRSAVPPRSTAQEIPTQAQTPNEAVKPAKTSAALREQIARARAARRAPGVATPNAEATYDDRFDLQDPFNQGIGKGESLLTKRIDSARLDGRLNISAMGLDIFPLDVCNMYDPEVMEARNVSWSTATELTRLNAADNEIKEVGDDVFPDARMLTTDDGAMRSNPFCAVETLDLHGNILSKLPLGLRQLGRLTTLNLARNKLDNSVFDVISQLTELKDLQLGENDLARELPSSVGSLVALENFDIHGNKISSLPTSLKQLSSLRALNISRNRLSGLPSDLLAEMPLREIDASSNAITGVLFDSSMDSLPHLQVLDVSGNSIGSLSLSESLEFPALTTLNVSNNRLSFLPDISLWQNLIKLIAENNGLTVLPDGFTCLPLLKTANLNGNNIQHLSEDIAIMDSLQNLSLHGNPLRERKFLRMSTDDIKRDLLKRITDAQAADQSNGDSSMVASNWELKPQGILDLSTQSLEELDSLKLQEFVDRQDSGVRSLVLAHNRLQQFPRLGLEILSSTLVSLDLSHNSLAAQYLSSPSLPLPTLRDLNVSGNKIEQLKPLLDGLSAPSLVKLNVSRNRVSGALPHLRFKFPQLVQLNADDNSLAEASAQALHGMQVVSLRGNDLTALDPEIGLLGELGLRSLEVRGNKFRVPSHTVLDKGTENLLEWLRMKLP